MSVAAAAAALALIAAGALAELYRAERRHALDQASRALAAAGAILLLFALGRPASRPAAVLALAAALVVPRSLACLLAAAAATVAALRAAPAGIAGPGASLLVAALALAFAAAAVEEGASRHQAHRRGAGWGAVVGGGTLALLLMVLDRGRVLRWRYGLGSGAARAELPGAAFVLGLALLVSLAGTLSMAAHLLASAAPPARARPFGQRLLVLGAGFGGLGVGIVAGQGLARSERALAAGALDLAALLLAVGLLVLALVRLLATPAAAEADAPVSGGDLGRERMLRLAAATAMLAAAAAGLEGWWKEGSYATGAVAEAASVALLGLAAVQPTRFGLARASLFLLGLLAILARAG